MSIITKITTKLLLLTGSTITLMPVFVTLGSRTTTDTAVTGAIDNVVRFAGSMQPSPDLVQRQKK